MRALHPDCQHVRTRQEYAVHLEKDARLIAEDPQLEAVRKSDCYEKLMKDMALK